MSAKMIYKLAALGAMGTTAYFVSIALSEQFSKNGTYPLLSQCLSHLQNNPLINERLTPPLYPSGHISRSDHRVHRRSHPIVETHVNAQGQEDSRSDFFVEDSQGRYARVHCQAIDGDISHLQIHFPQDRHPINIISPPPIQNLSSSGSNLLSKYFFNK